MSYRDYQARLHHGPIRGPYGSAWAEALGQTKDDLLARTKESTKVGFVGVCADDALARHGEDFDLPRLPGEAIDTYRARLLGAWETWGWAGTEHGLRVALNLLGWWGVWLPTVRQLGHPDPYTNLWARYYVFITGEATWGELAWASFNWGADLTIDASAPAWGAFDWGELLWGLDAADTVPAQIRATLRKWENARDRVANITFTFGAVLWGRETWGLFDWGDGGDPTALGSAFAWGDYDWGTSAYGAFYGD